MTTSESLASGLPMIIINPIPGQEEENAQFLEKKKAGIWLKKSDNIAKTLHNLFSDMDKLNEMKNNAKLLGHPNSTKNICDILLN